MADGDQRRREIVEALRGVALFRGLPDAELAGLAERMVEHHPVHAADLRALALFRDLTDGELAFVAYSAHEETAAPGDTIVRQWDHSRELYVILEGTAEVRTAERHVDDMGPGDFFGELAALDWGAGFGYPRLASVIATSPLRLFVLPHPRFQTLMRQVPAFEAQIRRAARERLPGL
jgi:CRP-like cAMP-binding protein